MRILPLVTANPFAPRTGRCALTFVPFDRTYGPPIYVAPSPTGWKSTGRRLGPDPDFATGIRLAGIA